MKARRFSVFWLLCLVLVVASMGMLSGCKKKHKADKAWTCDEDYHWHTCKVKKCDEIYDKAEHDWVIGEITKGASCTEEGKQIYRCSVCEKTKEVKLDMLPHNLNTSRDELGHWGKCANPGCTYEVSEKEPHDYTEEYMIREATETTGGFYGKVCKICGYESGYETLPLSTCPDLKDLRWVDRTGNKELTMEEMDDQGRPIVTYTIQHTYETIGEGTDKYIEAFYVNIKDVGPEREFTVVNIKDPDNPLNGANYYYFQSTYYYPMTNEVFDIYFDVLSSLNGKIYQESLIEEDLDNKALIEALLGKDSYYNQMMVTSSEDLIKLVRNYSLLEMESFYCDAQDEIFLSDGLVKSFKRYYGNGYSRTLRVNIDVHDIEDVKDIPVGEERATDPLYIEIDPQYSELISSANTYANDLGQINRGDPVDIQSYVETLDSSIYTVKGYVVYFDIGHVYVEKGQEIIVPMTTDAEICIMLDIEKVGAKRSIQVKIGDRLVDYTIDVYNEPLTLSDVEYYVWEDIEKEYGPGYKIDYTNDPNSNEPLSYDYVIEEGTILYPIIKNLNKATLKSSIDGKVVCSKFIYDHEIEYYGEIVGNKKYLGFGFRESIITDEGIEYEATGLYESINCLESEKVEEYYNGFATLYLLKDTSMTYYIKYERVYYLYIDDDIRIKLDDVLEEMEEYGFAAVYNEGIESLNYEITDPNITIEGLYTDKDCTKKLTNIEPGKDLHVYTKKVYAIDGYVITVDGSKFGFEDQKFVVYDLKNIDSDFDDGMEYISEYLNDTFEVDVGGFYLDSEYQNKLTEWPTSDVRVYPKEESYIYLVVLVDTWPAEGWPIAMSDIEDTYNKREPEYQDITEIEYVKGMLREVLKLLISGGVEIEEFYTNVECTTVWENEIVVGTIVYVTVAE